MTGGNGADDPATQPAATPAAGAGVRRARQRARRADAAPSASVAADAAEPARSAASPRRHPAWAVRAWQRLAAEPSLALSVGYVLVSLLGLWANYWFYRQFRLPILEYMQASDYLVAGLRDPRYLLALLLSVATALLLTWPETYRRRFPSRVLRYRRRWWGRALFPQARFLRWSGLGMKPETGIVFAVGIGMLMVTLVYVLEKAGQIREHGAGHAVQVTLSDASAPLPGQARLLGTSSAYVFLWRPRQRVAEAVPIEAVARLRSVAAEPVAAPPAKPRPRVDPARPAPATAPASPPSPAPSP